MGAAIAAVEGLAARVRVAAGIRRSSAMASSFSFSRRWLVVWVCRRLGLSPAERQGTDAAPVCAAVRARRPAHGVGVAAGPLSEQIDGDGELHVAVAVALPRTAAALPLHCWAGRARMCRSASTDMGWR
jgi:hypothetical protein